MPYPNDSIKRRQVLESIGAATALTTAPLAVSAKKEYPTVETGEYSDRSVADLAVDYAEESGNFRGPNHDRIAFTTTVFDGSLELYVADDVDSTTAQPGAIYQVTSNSTTGVMNLRWGKGNRLRFWRDANVYELKIPSSHRAFEPEKVGESTVPSDVYTNGGGA